MKVNREWLEVNNACADGKEWYLEQDFKSDKTAILGIQEHRNDWANWVLVRLMNRKQKMQHAVYAAKQVCCCWLC